MGKRLCMVAVLFFATGSMAFAQGGGGGGGGSSGGSAGGASAGAASGPSRSGSAAGAPQAGSAGAGTMGVNGVPNGPANAAGLNNSGNDPSGAGNSAKSPDATATSGIANPPSTRTTPSRSTPAKDDVEPSAPGTNTVGTAQSSGSLRENGTTMPGNGSPTRTRTEDLDKQIDAENKNFDSKVKSICKGC
jgi:hypothetical protein